MLNTLKTALTQLLHLSRDALHIHLGLGIYLVAMLLLRRGPTSWLPWLVLLAFELFNELLDTWHHGQIQVDVLGSTKDILNTMLWPTLLLIAARLWWVKRGRPSTDTGL
ncbi:hypothetical protein [Devosia rhizoryzae]|uniref:VanZ-like domain-containing protein n=1 Tax=Devosia rhizoryzae TaxID=2774137 RepID=A0ABX7C739_9HYPH|nr:hypothetical protein [Devosia rhizoryzae]QQR40080.1 hypothetical protein JI748_03440 [Devosia rhizoryzae]